MFHQRPRQVKDVVELNRSTVVLHWLRFDPLWIFLMGHETAERDEQREQRIAQIVGGSRDEYGRISAWYNYLDDHLRFPFAATCRSATGVAHESVEVIDLACVDDFVDEVLVSLGGTKYGQDVLLSEVQPTDAADEQTRQAIADWHYWVKRGYHFWTETED